MFCTYRHVFGVEGKGIHSIRMLDIALVDALMSLLVGVFIAYYFELDLYKTWASIFVIGILFHRLFCVNTTINKLFFGIV